MNGPVSNLLNIALVCGMFIVSGCGGEPPPAAAAPPEPAPAPPPAASAAPAKPAETAPAPITVNIESRSGSKLTGTATFTQDADGVKVSIQVKGAPAGKIATHVHEKGDCSAPDGASAGSHFNPANHPHGLPTAAERHLGDLGNIEVKADGTGSLEIVMKGANLKAGDANSYVGRAIIVHAKQDDGSQPVGNAGGRIGCGVIAAK